MLRVRALLLLTSIAVVGCSTTRTNQPAVVAPPPGWSATPPPITAPAPAGCSSCGSNAPIVNAPRYSPPMTVSPPMTSATPGLSIGAPVSAPLARGPIQVAFSPSVLPLESAKLGVVQADETPTIPMPPTVASE